MKPWKIIAIPHGDVSAGRYHQAEFAADLAQVLQGTAEPEYQDAVEFYNRTYLTEGMKRLLKTTIERVSGTAGEPVVKLKTSFGGGKTHTMLAIYHALNGTDPSALQGIPDLLKEVGKKEIPKCHIAILVGTALDPSKPRSHPEHNGLKSHTLWGEMAIQLGGPNSYKLIENADKKGVAPGSNTLVELFDKLGSCVILIDELVAFARNIYHVSDLPAGSFDSNMTFIHNLTEAVKRSRSSIVVASIPESNIEIGGEGGQAALDRLEDTFGRLEAIWQPVGQLESFEIVRRRIFSTIENKKERDATCSAFYKMYCAQSNDFPSKCNEAEYLNRLRTSYPFHPEFFDRLYEDWATLERFQRTRGVLRLSAAVVHELWTKNDQSPLIMPGSLPLYSPKIRDELSRYIGDQWSIIVDKDVDGEQSEPFRIDKESNRIGSIMAARKVARTIFLGSAPSVRQQNVRGIEDIRIRLGVAQPGENLSIYADALGRLTDKLTYLYHDNKRYWYDTRPNLRRTVEDRAAQLDQVDVENELKGRLQKIRNRGAFEKVHIVWDSTEILDEQEARLVILGPKDVHRGDRIGSESLAQVKAYEILSSKGSGPRRYKNSLIFLAPDANAIEGCLKEIRHYIAWGSVLSDADKLGLDTVQLKQAREQSERTNSTVDLRIAESYCWLLVPYQEIGDGAKNEILWDISKVSGGQEEGLAVKASKKVIKDQRLIQSWSPLLLKMELDRLLWKDKESINIKQLWEYLTTYLYLPRLCNEDVLLDAIKEGLRSEDFFAYSAGQDSDGKYLGIVLSEPNPRVLIDGSSLLLKVEVAKAQKPKPEPPETGTVIINGPVHRPAGPDTGQSKTALKRFYGSVTLDPQRVARDAGQIATEVIAHLSALPDAEVEVKMEIQVKVPKEVPEKVVQTVTENAKTLKFKNHSFETE